MNQLASLEAAVVSQQVFIQNISTLVSNYVEVHSFVLGVGFGLLIVLFWDANRWLALAFTLGAVSMMFYAPTPPLAVILQKPWYMLTGLTTTASSGILVWRGLNYQFQHAHRR